MRQLLIWGAFAYGMKILSSPEKLDISLPIGSLVQGKNLGLESKYTFILVECSRCSKKRWIVKTYGLTIINGKKCCKPCSILYAKKQKIGKANLN